jgi:putative transposase
VLERTLDGCRWVYNYFLDKNMSEYDMNYALTELKEQHLWLRNYHSKMLQMVGKQVAARKVAKGKLTYRKNDDFNAFTYNQSCFRIDDRHLYLSKVGSIKIVLHRLPVNIKQVTVCRKNGRWYAVVACEILRRLYSTTAYSKPVGIDVGISKFCHDSDNHVIENPQFLTRMSRPLRRAHRRVSRRKVGSSNHRKAGHMLARLYEKINNKRRDFLHKTSTYYSSRYDLVFLERLKVANLTRNHRLARKILDASWSTFKQMLQYKANRRKPTNLFVGSSLVHSNSKLLMQGKVCLVTGATSGIGKEIARGLSWLGATVAIAGRSREKCESALRETNSASYFVADLSSQAEVRKLAQEFLSRYDRLDVLVNNAGAFLAERKLTVDGVEQTFAVNHLAPFLLTNLLIDKLKASAPSRIITTSSSAHRAGQIDFDDINFEKRRYSGISAYSQSKLANVLFTYELTRRLAGTQVAANCFHPGAVRTNLVQGGSYGMVWKAAGPFFLSPEKGADTAVYLASSDEVAGVSGAYFVKRKQEKSSEVSYGEETAKKLWKLSEKLAGLG